MKFAKPQEKIVPSSQSNAPVHADSKCHNAKSNTQVLHVALSVHVLYERLKKAERLAERVLLFYQKRTERDLEEMAELCVELNELPLKNLNTVLEQIFAEHSNDEQMKCTLSPSACDSIMPSQNSACQMQGNTKCQHSKRLFPCSKDSFEHAHSV